MKKYLIVGITLGVLIFLIFAGRFGYRKYQNSRLTYPETPATHISNEPQKITPTRTTSPAAVEARQQTDENIVDSASKPDRPPRPQKILLNVPFTSQAPLANWDEVHEQTCEEAAVLMSVFALEGKTLNPQLAEDELLKIVEWQKENFGYFEDTNALETARIVTEYFGKKADIHYDFTTDEVKNELKKQRPVIVLAAGRLLSNPFYKQPGPIYHALVVRGYDGDTLITNDPGTRRGERYTYESTVVLSASHEWVGDPAKITEGRRVMISVYE